MTTTNQRRMWATALFLVGWSFFAVFGGVSAADEPIKSLGLEVLRKQPVPHGPEDLKTIEQAALQVARKVVQCTVGLQVGPAQGSGVIISSDGYVLTAAHVSGRPGRRVLIKLSSGKVLMGKSLGIHTTADGGLVKITEQGEWPFVPLTPYSEGSKHAPQVGDWCLATGHPNGFQTERTAPVRLGRIIDVQKNVIRTDCPLMGGDSGGPLFDLQGRVIGIHSRISQDVTINLHAPVLACKAVWDELVTGKIYPSIPPTRFFDKLDKNGDGKLTRSELPAGYHQRVFDRLAEKLDLDPNQSHSIKDLVKKLDWRVPTFPMVGRGFQQEDRLGSALLKKLYVRGRAVRDSFKDVVAGTRKSTVLIRSGGKRVGLGIVVHQDGWVVTKASELGDETTCELLDGRTFSAQIAHIEKDYDLALLRTDQKDLTAVQWGKSSELEAGRWLISPGIKTPVESVGVVSVRARKIETIPGVLGVAIARNDEEARIEQVFDKSGAKEAGMQVGDVITHIMDQEVGNLDELREALKVYRPSDTIRARISRDGKALNLKVTLGAHNDVFFPFSISRRLNGALSRRRDGFPQAIQHDSVIHPTLCGGPLVDLSGKVVGLNLARADRIATYAVPGEVVQLFVKKQIETQSSNK